MKLCVVPDCSDHRDEPGWTHVRATRETPVTADLRGVAKGRAA